MCDRNVSVHTRLLPIVAILLLLPITAAAQTSSSKLSLDDLRFLIGDWEAVGEGGPGVGKGGFSFAFDLQNKIIVRRSYAEYPASANRPAMRHDDLMVIYIDDSSNQMLATFFDTESHQINYKVVPSPDRQTVTFLSEASSAQPRYRLSYAKLKDGTLSGKFEIASPDKPEGFKNYLQWIGRKK